MGSPKEQRAKRTKSEKNETTTTKPKTKQKTGHPFSSEYSWHFHQESGWNTCIFFWSLSCVLLVYVSVFMSALYLCVPMAMLHSQHGFVHVEVFCVSIWIFGLLFLVIWRISLEFWWGLCCLCQVIWVIWTFKLYFLQFMNMASLSICVCMHTHVYSCVSVCIYVHVSFSIYFISVL